MFNWILNTPLTKCQKNKEIFGIGISFQNKKIQNILNVKIQRETSKT